MLKKTVDLVVGGTPNSDNDHDDKITWKALVDPAIPIAHTSDALDGDDIEDNMIR